MSAEPDLVGSIVVEAAHLVGGAAQVLVVVAVVAVGAVGNGVKGNHLARPVRRR